MHVFSPRQAAENAAFLATYRRTGNSTLAARETGLNRSTMRGRRARSAVFAAQWEAARLAAHAALKLAGGPRPAEETDGRTCPPKVRLRTEGGEIIVGRTRGGRLQLRRAPPGRMTAEGEQSFFRALAASANVRLSAAAAGFTHSAFYQKKKKWPAFAREMKISLSVGFDRLEWALMESAEAGLTGARASDSWHEYMADAPLPPMTVSQAIQLVSHHRNTARLEGALRDRRRSKREPTIEAVRDQVGKKLDAIERAAHYEETGSWRYSYEAALPKLPPLDQVTGWSKADPARKPHHPERAMFGGWRIEDWKRSRR